MREVQLSPDEIEEAWLHACRSDILLFTQHTKPDYQVNWHHQYLAKRINAFVRGDIKYLMVFMPPRHGKSEIVSRRLPAFIHGIYPDAEIMAASYLDSLAADMSIDVQNVIDSKEYQEIFPGTKIWPPGTSYTRGTRNSSEHHIVGRKGKYRGQGVGGSFTGKGANCFPGGTTVDTHAGYADISTLKVGDNVWSYNHETNRQELKKVQAISSKHVSRMVQVTTARGRQVLCTPEHPFFCTEKQEYRPAVNLKSGDVLARFERPHASPENGFGAQVRPLLEAVRKASLRIYQSFQEKYKRGILLKSVLPAPSQREEPAQVCRLQLPDGDENPQVLPGVQAEILEPTNCDIRQSIQKNKTSRYDSRPNEVQPMLLGEKNLGSPYRRGREKQYLGEPDHSLSAVPYGPSPCSDQVVSVKEVSFVEKQKVYDIQVEGNHNFFAQGILVHNCIIIDDPIKGREIADSEAFRERLWNFYNNDLLSRLETDLVTGKSGQVLITLTRWHEDDLAGRLLDLARNDKSAIQWEIIDFPAIKIDNSNTDDPRPIGEPLWPQKYNNEQLAAIKASIGPRAWSSLYQQSPVPDGGGLFNESMFSFSDLPPEFDWTFITADTSYKEKQENDFTVFSAWGVIKEELYLIDVYMKQIKASDIENDVTPFISKFKKYGFRSLNIEPKGHGIYLNQKWMHAGFGIPSEGELKEFYSDRRFSKVERANNIAPHLANRKVYFNKTLANKEDLVAQCLGFPKMKHDDFVDTLVDAVKKVYNRNVGILDVL